MNPPPPPPTPLVRASLAFAAMTAFAAPDSAEADDAARRVAEVVSLPGLVAFWDFAKREPSGGRRFVAHVPEGSPTDYPLDADNYALDYWGEGRPATYDDFPMMGRGPFGEAIRIRREEDEHFRPLLLVPRERLHDTPLDIKGADRSVSVVVWAIRESGNHALAGIWHEGTDLRQASTEAIRRVERGQRQYALFAGLSRAGGACGHVSENGASSFTNRYALHKSHTPDAALQVPADSPPETLDAAWHCFAMSFDHERQEIAGWLDGTARDNWLERPERDNLISYARLAYLQGHYARLPGGHPEADPGFPADQHYNPPEDESLSVEILGEEGDERVERRRYPYTEVEVVLRRDADGAFVETGRDLVGLRINPWWYPHGIYEPDDDGSGGPFTIGRVIHSARSIGFTGWIGGVAVFDRALESEEMAALAAIAKRTPVALTSAD